MKLIMSVTAIVRSGQLVSTRGVKLVQKLYCLPRDVTQIRPESWPEISQASLDICLDGIAGDAAVHTLQLLLEVVAGTEHTEEGRDL